ncbi:PREDICTED: protein NRT1/ PTR FAMILY 1.2 [Ipomoea nil]|uniref:protein NRT1/ PTR FAMILY 1.2 n=1 Tax=Ipomoea nil TaxID=35883 RepID=UPI000901F141|nr:PREDICTED: protein NRT1/ PTR FAMILY 1.2 [Ipomoea nil]
MKKLEMELSSPEPKQMESQVEEEEEGAAGTATFPREARSKGGLVTMPFVIANEALEKVSSYGLAPNMILYLMKDYGMGVTKGQNLLFFWSAATNFMPLLGAFVADSYLGRFLTIALGSVFSFLGMVVLWLTAMIRQLRPACTQLGQPCKTASPAQYFVLISSFVLMSIGAGGIRPCSLAFGADQLDKKDNPENRRVLESFFGWYYASAAVSVVIALTGIVYIQDHLGWKVGFGVPAILMLVSVILFIVASPLYVKRKRGRNLFSGFARVLVAAYKNRKLSYPSKASDYHCDKGSDFIVPSGKLRFLNKACIIKNPEDLKPDGVPTNPWGLCTVEQVEELKALIRVIPLWSTGIMLSINLSQSSFPLLQANSMNRHVTKSFQIPAGSFGLFTISALTIWVVLYDRVILPLASKVRGKPVCLSPKSRMGIGIFLSALGMLTSGVVEHVRRGRAIEQGLLNNPKGMVEMSAMWLVPQHCLNGLAEAFNAIGQTEFYYSELPKSMSSIASSMFGLGMAVANLLASVILSTVDRSTGGEGKESWVSSNINKGHYEYYYWLLAIMTTINLLYFCGCSWLYGPCVQKLRSKENIEGDNNAPKERLSTPGVQEHH